MVLAKNGITSLLQPIVLCIMALKAHSVTYSTRVGCSPGINSEYWGDLGLIANVYILEQDA